MSSATVKRAIKGTTFSFSPHTKARERESSEIVIYGLSARHHFFNFHKLNLWRVAWHRNKKFNLSEAHLNISREK